MLKLLKKKKKIHDDEPFLIAYILRNSRSVNSLLQYINSHPGGRDAARKDIIKIKYWYSKCSPVIKNIVRKMVTHFEYFQIEKDHLCEIFSDDMYEFFNIIDIENNLQFKINTNEVKISISMDVVISTEIHDYTMFLYATRSVMYIKKNIKIMEKSKLMEDRKQEYINAYK